MKEIILGVVLGIQGIIDFRKKEIPLWISVFGAVVGLGFCVIEIREIKELVFACLPGIVALIFSKVTKEAIGYGDSILLLVMGMYLSAEEILAILMLALGIAGIVALVLLVVLRKNGRYEIPFVPFLCIAFWLEYVTALGEGIL